MFRTGFVIIINMIPSIYKGKKSSVLSALTFNDAAFWGADVFVGVVFALFITQNIDGGTAIHVGLVFGLYRLIRAFAAILIGRYLDEHKGHVDEYYTLLVSGFVVGFTYIALFFSTELWHVYFGMAGIALGHALDISAWRILFYDNIPDESKGEVIGIYETTMQIVYGLAIVVAGFVGEIYGFEWAFLFAGMITILSSIILVSVRNSKNKM